MFNDLYFNAYQKGELELANVLKKVVNASTKVATVAETHEKFLSHRYDGEFGANAKSLGEILDKLRLY